MKNNISIPKNKIHGMKNAGKNGIGVLIKILRFYMICCFCFVILYPVIYMISKGFRSFDDLYDISIVWVPKNYSLHSFKMAFETMNYPTAALTSGGIALLATMLQMVSCSIAGYGFARFQFPFKKTLFALCLVSIMVPQQMILIPTFMQFKYFNILGIGSIFKLFTGSVPDLSDSIWTVIIPAMLANGIRGSMYIFIFRQFFRGIPKDLEDAAYIDGAGHVRTFLNIIVPNAGAPFLIVFVLSMIWYWNDSVVTTFLYGSAEFISRNLLSVISVVSGISEHNYIEALAVQEAGAVLMLLPPLIMFLFLQKFFVESIDKTGLK
ncbi:MAG: carbohydrate ABC transporter permease [Oscillospiraceae bacterium]|nr:carbohydrate ABC transporter permease [Oscillospiraceae bacterium]